MGHNIQHYQGRLMLFDDIDLYVVLSWTARKIPNETRDSGLRTIAEDWIHRMERCGPGTLLMDFDGPLYTPEVIGALSAILSEVDAELATFEGKIPAKTLNDLIAAPGVVCLDGPDPALFRPTIERLRGLWSGSGAPDEA